MAYKQPSLEPIVVVGSSCRFAGGATSPAKLWDVLRDAPDLSREVPPGRFNAKAFYHPDGEYHGTTNSIKAYWLDQDHRVFDAGLFNITPKEAEAIDPQQRLLLEVVYEAMESAGYTLNTYSGKKVSVFAGVMTADYDTLSQRDELSTSQYYATGNARSIISNRISYFYNFHGPSMTIDTACSSSLVALHQAVMSLRCKESTMACVTGVNLMITPEQFLVESSLHMLSPTGNSRMWDASANGYARGEGVAALFLKPLSRALADGDNIIAVIRETGVNSDGRTKGITLPNPHAQSTLIKETYQKTGLDASSPEDRCQYFEAHGTGTPAGDPREAEAIYEAFFGGGTDTTSLTPYVSHTPEEDGAQLLVGSCKTILGHTEGAAGLAGLLKVIESMKHGLVPPNLHLESVNPTVAPFCTRLNIPTKLVPWPNPPAGQPKRASVNSFGFGGTNAHVIVEAYDPNIHDQLYAQTRQDANDISPGNPTLSVPLLMSAASQKSLRAVITAYRDYLLKHPDVSHDQLAWALYSRRTALPYRLAIPANSTPRAIKLLEETLSKASTTNDIGLRSKTMSGEPKILGIFTGQGAQWATMSRSLFYTNRHYQQTIRRLDNVLRTCPNPPSWTLAEQILAEGGDSMVDIAFVSQPLCTAIQVALIDLLKSIGISFHTVVGHSSGEIAAAYAAGKLSDRDAILISYYRGFLAHRAGGSEGQKGGMLAAGISEKEAFEFCAKPEFNGKIYVAASNAPSSVTLSGHLETIQMAHEELGNAKKFLRILRVDSAYHSPHMLGPAGAYVEALEESKIKPMAEGNGTIWISSVHGRPMHGNEDLGPEYWKENMVSMVRFHDAVVNAISQHGPFDCALEIGPHPALKGPFTQCIKPLGHDIPYSSPLVRSNDSTASSFSDFLGFLWCLYGQRGFDFSKYLSHSSSLGSMTPTLTNLPTYPWDHSQVHYRESRISQKFHFKKSAPHELLGVRTRDDNDHELRWRNMLRLEKLPWVEHHSFQGHALLPASAYCIMALDAARSLLEGKPATVVELQDLDILGGINVDRDSAGIEVLFTLTILPQQKGPGMDSTIEASFTLASCPDDGTTAMRLNMRGNLKIHLGEPSSDALPSRDADKSETLQATPESFYKMMERTGLMYTGPFRALESIQRRYNYCSATLKRRHADDTTTLEVSPATLDSCFQSAFLSYASPADGSLWTSFLPVRIDRVCFNLTMSKSGNLTVDTHMADIKPSAPVTKATFVVDMEIFNEAGGMEVQVEGLTVAAVAHTLPKDDYELYLHTVMDVDPNDEIVSRDLSLNTMPEPALIESCARVATFFVREYCNSNVLSSKLDSYYETLAESFPSVLGMISNDSWSSETEESIANFIENSKYYDHLDLIRSLDNREPTFVSEILETLVDESHHISHSNRHVGRIVKQIAHRYPGMNILSIAGPETELVADVLTAIESSFSSFTIGNGAPRASSNLAIGLTEKILSKDLDLSKNLEAQLGSEKAYDLVLLSATELDNENAIDILRSLHDMMRLGGFLIVIQLPKTIKDGLLRGKNRVVGAPTPPQWPDALEAFNFSQVAKNCDQSFYPGYSIMVRQLISPVLGHQDLRLARRPSEMVGDDNLTNHLLVIGCDKIRGRKVADGLVRRLSPMCDSISFSATLDGANAQVVSKCTMVIILADLDGSLMHDMTQRRIDQLRELLRPNMKVIWLTMGARDTNPMHSASFGFARTIAAEVPSLMLQMLDLGGPEDLKALEDIVMDNFVRLAVSERVDDDALWIDEREIHIDGGRRLIPRVRALKSANDRVNALRRVVSSPCNSLQESIEVVAHSVSDSVVRYDTRVGKFDTGKASPGQALIRVDYSSLEAVRLDIYGSNHSDTSEFAHLCFGYNLSTEEWVMAISASNASYISVPKDQVYPLRSGPITGLPLVSLATRYLVANAMVNRAGQRRIVLIDADPTLAQCVKEVASAYGGRISVTWYSTAPIANDQTPSPRQLHPQCAPRVIKTLFPPSGAIVYDFHAAGHTKLSERILEFIPASSTYCSSASMFSVDGIFGGRQAYYGKATWTTAVMRALKSEATGLQERARLDAVSIPDLTSGSSAASTSFRVIDWQADRAAAPVTNHLVGKQLFRPDRTYVLVGLTKDFGQSLCYLLTEHGARNIVLASRNPKTNPEWIEELSRAYDAKIEIRKCDVTDIGSVKKLKADIAESMPQVGGIANGAMVLDDRVFAQMDADTWERVMQPKTIGSYNLSTVFDDPDLEFFIMTSSFAAIGGHPGQSNYAAANMYMNGLAGMRRKHGMAGSVLNIGVIYGLGFLQREKEELYIGLEREGYPPISERDIHHMFLEAVAAGRPPREGEPEALVDLTTGLSRFDPTDENPLHWHTDPRFGHYTRQDVDDSKGADAGTRVSLKDTIAAMTTKEEISQTILAAFTERLHTHFQLEIGTVDGAQTLSELGVDSLAAVEIRGWVFKGVGKDVSVIKLLGSSSIQKLCTDLAEQIIADRA
ncbi:hypothetical protein M426DRAFT_261564 [Hypoxylon sp. CI-4A]|nr:hypothetical protein M426DRAFT_261564 [Hypoxylon sp. CI-4A]